MKPIALISIGLLMVVLIHTGDGLKCMRNDVTDPEKFIEETCMDPPSQSEAACLTQVYIDSKNKDRHVEKKCVQYAMGTKFECFTKTNMENEKCETCKSDLCNKSGAASLLSLKWLVFVTVASLGARFMTPKAF